MQSFEQQRNKFLNLLERYTFPKEPAALYDACRHILSIGGKRVRPVLCLMAQEVFSEVNKDGMNAALAIELFHNFSLVHDDIMDKADIRRGESTVHKKYSEPTAILAGDAMNVFAYELLNELQSPKRKAVFSLFNKTSIGVCEGQQMDMGFEERENVSIEEYLKMIELKTSVLLAASLGIGALLGEATEADVQNLYEFGKNVGIAFQLKDDYLDSYGQQDKIGKKVGGDIIANKKTIFYCYCYSKADDVTRELMGNLKSLNDNEKVSQTLDLYHQLGAKDYVYDLKDQYSKKAFESLEKVDVSEEKLLQLRDVAKLLLKRDH